MDFTIFFAPPAPAPAKKRRATKAKPPPKRLKQLPSTPLPPKFASLLTSYDQLRQVARSLEAMRVRTTLAQLWCGANYNSRRSRCALVRSHVRARSRSMTPTARPSWSSRSSRTQIGGAARRTRRRGGRRSKTRCETLRTRRTLVG